MKTLVAVIASLVTISAHADIIKCSFTEPFYSLQYSMTQSALLITSPDGSVNRKNISFQIMGPGVFQLRNSSNQIVMRLYLDGTGSDGMSDTVYPYRARWNGQWGGCTSNFQHADQPMTYMNPQ